MRSSFSLFLLALFASGPVHADPLHDAAKSGDLSKVTSLLDTGADIDAMDAFGTPLHWAVLNKHDDVTRVLVSRGASLALASKNLGTPLHAAVQRGLAEQVALLLEFGSAADVPDLDGKTPLQVAAFNGRTEIAQILLGAGADPNAIGANEHGAAWGEGSFTALHVARYNKRHDVVSVLNDAGATPIWVLPEATTLAAGNADAGAELAASCGRCHAYLEGQDTPNSPWSGPSLVGVFNRPVASVPGYNYTEALSGVGETWTAERLFGFVSHPMLAVPGTRMVFEDIRDPAQISDLIAFFREQAE